jgi:hypothetical protein
MPAPLKSKLRAADLKQKKKLSSEKVWQIKLEFKTSYPIAVQKAMLGFESQYLEK